MMTHHPSLITVVGAACLAAFWACSDSPTDPDVRTALEPPPAAHQSVDGSGDPLPALDYEAVVLGSEVGLRGFVQLLNDAGVAVVRGPLLEQYFVDGTDVVPFPTTAGELSRLPVALLEDGTVLGQIALIEEDGTGALRGAIWTRDDVTLLEGLPWAADGSGTVVGSIDRGDGVSLDAAIWQDGVLVQRISSETFDVVRAVAINESGDIVLRRRSTGTDEGNVVIWNDGVIRPLPDVGIGITAPITATDGQVFNESAQLLLQTIETPRRQLFFDGATAAFVNPLAGTNFVNLIDLNNAGVAVGGSATFGGGPARAVRLAQGVLEDLGSFGGSFSFARKITEDGVIVGSSETQGGPALAWVAGAGLGGLRALVTPVGTPSAAYTVNEQGVIGGYYGDDPENYVPVLWVPATPDAIVENLEEAIEDLVQEGMLNGGVGGALTEKLADGAFGAFVNQTRALVRSRRLDPAMGETLIEAAEGLMD